ncbi:FHS family glucose/mannose:H+ symporter-like MFS transporter [Chryseobacterium ginsenosidimutans]|uniref:MFS transporter n=1 Tax=Chryseobacterium ginsenosidimutans TaxID=687846 RepID=UPI00278610F7|nr:MFS transporter [Chryseobacterium ginsenosidimutans]MDQ0594637.1 FHS family glucose/mannose:H+ symporter-like MFS transporter [Chryseobacterium ginsenosidimutans]
MNSRIVQIVIIFLLAFFTGVNFVVFPALGTAFIDSSLFGLSSSQFGSLFIPQVICIIISCLGAPFLVNKFGPKIVLVVGLLLMITSTGVLWMLQFFMNDKSLLFPILMVLVAFTGSGFGLSITTLNPLAASLFEKNKSSAILILQFLVGLGTSTSPMMMNLIGNVKNWMYVPASIFLLVTIIFILFLFLKLEKGTFFELPKHFKIPSKLWIFFIVIVLYGFIEGTFGSFGAIILKNQGLDNNKASLGLSLFWGGIALNRLLFGIFSRNNDLSYLFLVTPLIVAGLLFLLLIYPNVNIIIVMMFLIGFFMGSIFPGSIGWGTVEFPTLSVLVSGFLMAANQIGTGIITNVLGNFSNQTNVIFRFLIVCMILICVLLFYLKRNSKIKEAF